MRRKGEKGISLTELLVVLAVISVFALITIPAFRDFMNAFKVKSTAFQIRDVVRLGRQIAVAKKGRVVTMIDLDARPASGQGAYDAWDERSSPWDEVKDGTEKSIRPIPGVPKFVKILQVDRNNGDPITSGQVYFHLESNGTIERSGAGPTETRWCVLIEMRINSKRTDQWWVFLQNTGKADHRFNENPCT